MVEWLMLFMGALLCLAGIIGSFLPVIPGPPLSFVAILLLHFSGTENRVSYTLLAILLLFTIIITMLDYVIPIWGTKKFGGTKYGIWGSTIGLIVGLFFGPIGIVLGPFLGALIGEMYAGSDSSSALRSAWGSLLGFLVGTGLKLLFTLSVATIFFSKLIPRIGDLIQNG